MNVFSWLVLFFILGFVVFALFSIMKNEKSCNGYCGECKKCIKHKDR